MNIGSDSFNAFPELQAARDAFSSKRNENWSIRVSLLKHQLFSLAMIALFILAFIWLFDKIRKCVSCTKAMAEAAPQQMEESQTVILSPQSRPDMFMRPDFNTLNVVLSNEPYTWTLRYTDPSIVSLLCPDNVYNVFYINNTTGKLTVMTTPKVPKESLFLTNGTGETLLISESNTSLSLNVIDNQPENSCFETSISIKADTEPTIWIKQTNT